MPIAARAGIWGVTDHVVAPVSHCPFEIVCTTIRLAKALQPLSSEKTFLLLFSHTAQGTANGRGQGLVRFQIILKPGMQFIENGDLNVNQESKLVRK